MENISRLVENERCCLRCIGRALGQKGYTSENYYLKLTENLPQEITSVASNEDDCIICKGIVLKAISLVEPISNKISDFKFQSYLLGCQISKEQEKLDQIFTKYYIVPVNLKHEILREIGIRLGKITNKLVDYNLPDITVIIDLKRKARFKLQIKSIYILGRYCKLVRGIPQTKWPCSKCKGKGCETCSLSGQQYPYTVEGIVAEPFFVQAKTNKSSFHGAGREDIDALMLGKGRPFVLELKNPKQRFFDLNLPKSIINQSKMVNVNDLQFCQKEVIKLLKEQSSDSRKIYRAIISISQLPSDEKITKLIEYGDGERIIKQRTPKRVSHRRSDLIREKKIYWIKITSHQEDYIIIEIAAQGGTYIKEFISGDDGRSIPSISSILCIDAICKELDVLEVSDKSFFS